MSNSYVTDQTPAGDFSKQTIGVAASTITAAKLAINQVGGFVKRAVKAHVSVETNNIRVRWDGTAPDSTTGHLLTPGDTLTVEGESNVSNLSMIRVTNDATVHITLYYIH